MLDFSHQTQNRRIHHLKLWTDVRWCGEADSLTGLKRGTEGGGGGWSDQSITSSTEPHPHALALADLQRVA